MKRIPITGLSLLAVFTFSAVAVGSASAKEVLFQLGKGKFPATFTSKGGEARVVTKGGTEFICTTVSSKGEIGNITEDEGKTAHLGKVEIKFKGCKSQFFECRSKGAAAEEVIIPSTEFHLGLAVNKESIGVPALLILLPGGTPKEPLAGKVEFLCAGITVILNGDVIGELQNEKGEVPKVGQKLKIAKLMFEQKAKGEQKFKEFLLSLTKSENELMTEQDAKVKVGSGSEELLSRIAGETLEKFANSVKEETTIELAEG